LRGEDGVRLFRDVPFAAPLVPSGTAAHLLRSGAPARGLFSAPPAG
jgi:hypothetical protein